MSNSLVVNSNPPAPTSSPTVVLSLRSFEQLAFLVQTEWIPTQPKSMLEISGSEELREIFGE